MKEMSATCLRLVIAAMCCAFSATLFGQNITIKVVDGRNGHPMANSHVNVWIGTKQKNVLALPTDQNGIAHFNLPGENEMVRLNVPYVLCEPNRGDYSWLTTMNLSAGEILQKGIVTPNTCGKVTAHSRPGE